MAGRALATIGAAVLAGLLFGLAWPVFHWLVLWGDYPPAWALSPAAALAFGAMAALAFGTLTWHAAGPQGTPVVRTIMRAMVASAALALVAGVVAEAMRAEWLFYGATFAFAAACLALVAGSALLAYTKWRRRLGAGTT